MPAGPPQGRRYSGGVSDISHTPSPAGSPEWRWVYVNKALPLGLCLKGHMPAATFLSHVQPLGNAVSSW